ncbi:MAG: GGDEF domain-containing protein [Methylophilaceae bacterium 17-44-8]|jgi:diguanylate cyclase (GGDEF)-like protein|nr:MAG: GGDEF domain-containing protein [Methylophilales bacterium 28-44-11]OZA04670.1 MAG: GGDEF domain-containing protein [Methylophilaceae bacterium 17-44-8]
MSFFNKLGIKARMMLLTVVPTFAITLFLTSYSISKSINTLNDSLSDRGRIIATQVAPASEYGVLSGNITFLQTLIQQTISREDDIISILITDNEGFRLAVSGQTPYQVKPNRSNDLSVKEINEAEYIVSNAPIIRNKVEIDDFYDGTNNMLEANKRAEVVGQVYVALSKDSIRATKKSMIWKSLLLGFIGFLVSSLLAYRLGRSITNPIVSMAESVKNLGAGHLNLRVDEDAAGEIKTLQLGLNTMANHIQLAHDNLQDRVHDATRMLRHQAQHDALTGLVNRQEFERRLNVALNDVKISNAQHIFCYMDLDQFKVVNDTCGHRAGDELLRQISLILSQRVREEDTFARLGGDEFGLLLTNCDIQNALLIAEEMRSMVEDFRFVHDNRMFKIGVSIGMVEITPDMQDLGDITSYADAACYAAKDNGRNQVHLFRHHDDDLARRHVEMEWVSRINSAMDDNRFCLYCQPILPLQDDNNNIFYEILIRKIDVDGTIILPMAFIPSAERYHLMSKIDRWVINKTFSIYHQLINTNEQHDFLLTINLSGMSLSDKGLLSFIKDQFELYNVPHTKICFEITETSAIINLTNTITLMQELKAIGCKFLLDDFGSGMSSFAYLKNLPVDYLKMDGGFVKDITRNEIDLAMAKSIQSIAEAMKIKTIAEFVEDAATMKLLKKMGVDYGQGFYLSSPMPIESALGNFRQLSLLQQTP